MLDRELVKALNNKLLPGVKSEQTAAERLEAVHTLNTSPSEDQLCQRGVTIIMENHDDYMELENSADFLHVCQARVIFPDYITRTVNAIGNVKVLDRVYYPKVAANRKDYVGHFSLQSERILLSNLRETVTHRRFYSNNPTSGAQWSHKYLLLNPNDIILENYSYLNFADDFDAIQAKIDFLAKKKPKFSAEPISYEVSGSKIQLASSAQSGMRVKDRRRGQTFEKYYNVMRIDTNFANAQNGA
ncbi:hypothetical protein KM043_001327 [Ampulex compressa]|nr:hypothetical protein KM043_001327 [Ampulex compressa]